MSTAAAEVRPGEQIVVVGASAAGLAAVEALRRAGWEGGITLVGEEPHAPYDRPPLSKQVLGGSWEPERVSLRSAGQLDGLGLELRLGSRAVGVDPAARTVRLQGPDGRGETLPYRGLIAATGVRAQRLPGQDAGVHVLRTLDDALALRTALGGGRTRVAVVGAGVLGAEAAAVARTLGHEAVLFGSGAEPMEAVLGRGPAALLGALHRDHGVELRLGERVSAALPDGVKTADGGFEAAGAVLAAVGSEPCTEWLDGAGLDLADGLGCDAYCAAAPGLYGAGDVARWEHRGYGRRLRVEHRMNATEQGMAAARNLLGELDPERFGERRPFTPVPYFWSDQFGVKVQAYGVLHEGPETCVETVGAAALYGSGPGGTATGAAGVGLPPRAARGLRALAAGDLPWGEAVDALKRLAG